MSQKFVVIKVCQCGKFFYCRGTWKPFQTSIEELEQTIHQLGFHIVMYREPCAHKIWEQLQYGEKP